MSLQGRQQKRHADREARKNTVISARQPQRGAVLLGVGLAAAARVLRDRRCQERAIAGLVVQTALVRIAREGLGRAVRDVVAWDNARLAEWEEELRRRRMAGAPAGAVPDGAVASARQPGAEGRRGAAWSVVGLVVAARVVRDLRLGELAILGFIVLAALAQVTGKDLADILRALITWDNARLAELNERMRRQHEAKAERPAAS